MGLASGLRLSGDMQGKRRRFFQGSEVTIEIGSLSMIERIVAELRPFKFQTEIGSWWGYARQGLQEGQSISAFISHSLFHT